MKNFLQLFNFEFKRIYKLYVTILITVVVIQTGGVIASAVLHKAKISKSIKTGMKPEEINSIYDKFTLWSPVNTLWFAAPIVIAIVAMLFYSFFIWYRDWLGKNTFIYRLLMLPTNRMNIFFAKLATIMVSVLSLVAIQYLLLILYTNIVQWIVPTVYRLDMTVTSLTSSTDFLDVLMPGTITDFMEHYSLGLLAVILIFVVILLERSFRMAGTIIGLAYVFTTIIVLNVPNIIQYIIYDHPYFYPAELLLVQSVVFIMMTGLSLVIGRNLMKNRVTV